MAPASDFNYKKYLQLIAKKRYLFVIVALLIMTGVVATSYLLPPKYEAKSTVFIEKSVIADLVKGIAVTPSMEDKVRLLIYAMKSRSLLLKVFDDLDLNVTKESDAQLEEMVKKFQDRTDIKLNDKDGLFMISFTDENPRLARDYVNSLVRRYIEENTSSKRKESYGANKFLSEQITPVKEKLEQIEARENSFKKANANILGEDEESILTGISIAQGKLDDTTIRLNQLQAVRDMNRGVNPLRTKLADLQKRLHELTIVYTDNYPEVIELKSQIGAVEEQLKKGQGGVEHPQEDQKLRIEMNVLRQSEQNLRRFIASKQALLRMIPTTKSALDDITREKESQLNLYNSLLARYGQSEVSTQMEVQDKATTFRIVDPAVMPIKPVSPNRVRMILVGIFAGLAGSLALLVLLDYLDSSVRDLDTLKSLGVPVLAIVPKIQNPADLAVARKRDFWFFVAAGAYFSIILGILSVEAMRDFSIDLTSADQIKQNLSYLKTMVLK